MSYTPGNTLPARLCPRCDRTNQLAGDFCPNCGAAMTAAAGPGSPGMKWAEDWKQAWNSHSGRIAIILCACLGLVLAGSLTRAYQYRRLQGSPAFKAHLARAEQEERQRKQRAEAEANPVEVLRSSWQKGGFGSVAVWHITFYNGSDEPVGNIKYRTRYYSETGNVVGSGGTEAVGEDRTIQKVIPPHQKRTIRINDGFLHREAADAVFEVVGWEFLPRSSLDRALTVID